MHRIAAFLTALAVLRACRRRRRPCGRTRRCRTSSRRRCEYRTSRRRPPPPWRSTSTQASSCSRPTTPCRSRPRQREACADVRTLLVVQPDDADRDQGLGPRRPTRDDADGDLFLVGAGDPTLSSGDLALLAPPRSHRRDQARRRSRDRRRVALRLEAHVPRPEVARFTSSSLRRSPRSSSTARCTAKNTRASTGKSGGAAVP